MALSLDQLVQLTIAVGKANPAKATTYSFNGQNLSYEAMSKTLSEECKALGGTYALYRENKNKLFTLMEQAMDEILPAKVMDRYMDLAEVRVFPQGSKPVFTRKMGRTRAKQFVTRVGLAGVYEVFKLGEESFEIGTSAMGGAAQIGFEEFLDGRADFAEVVNIVMEGMDDLLFAEIAKAMNASMTQLPAANQVATAGFDEASMDRLVSVASVYGNPVIYCTREFASEMIPSTSWISDNMRNEMWSRGYLANYKGVPVIIIPQSVTDETNSTKVIDPGYAWVVPNTADNRPVKVAFEGETHVRERENEDWSRDMQCYRKVGVGVMLQNNICIYKNTDLAGKMAMVGA